MFQLDLTSPKSIYEQVIDNMKELIVTGVMPEGSRLPSVRELSKDLTVNPNTIQKAYRELEREGFIYTASGRGTFVADVSIIKPDDAKIQNVEKEILGGFRSLIYLGLSFDEAKKIVETIIDTEERSKRND